MQNQSLIYVKHSNGFFSAQMAETFWLYEVESRRFERAGIDIKRKRILAALE